MSAILDLAGIGAGPFNLAVAALLHQQPLTNRFFEAKPEFSWHPGMMLPNAKLQTSYLKDLVTPVDPTNPHSFLAYLVAKRRFYDFMNAEQSAVSRQEFADYLAWVANRLPNLQLDSPVSEIEDAGDHFRLQIKGQTVRARNLCVAAGKRPYVPSCCASMLSSHCFHALDIAQRKLDLNGLRVAVIGGGQTGAEIVLNALNNHWGQPASVAWASRRANFQPLDETPFTNDWFTPDYVETFRQLSATRRTEVVQAQKLASDGISPSTLKELYQLFYRLNHLENNGDRITLLPNRELQSLQHSNVYGLTLANKLNDELEYLSADVVILCTGLEEALPDCLAPIQERLKRDEYGRVQLDAAFAAQLHGKNARKLYLLNAGRHSHGIAEPQLSLSAWRGACVINDLSGRKIYETCQTDTVIKWTTSSINQAAVA